MYKQRFPNYPVTKITSVSPDIEAPFGSVVTLQVTAEGHDLVYEWQKNGSLDTQARAMLRVRDILSHDSAALFSPEVDARIRAEYTDLIPGKLEMPEGW